MALACTPENFRAEIARHALDRASICHINGMNPNELSMYVGGSRPLTGWAAHNIGYAINRVTKLYLFDVDMSKGAQRATLGRPPDPTRRLPITLPVKKRKRKKLRSPKLGTYSPVVVPR